MKRLLLLSFIVLGALNARAQIVNERNKEKISQAVKDGYKEVMQTIKQDAHPTGVHTQWDLYVGARLGLNASNLPGLNGNMKTGITGGVFMEVFVFPNLAADIEVEYSHQGSGNVYHTVATDADAVFRSGPYDYNIKYINTNYLARWYPWADKHGASTQDSTWHVPSACTHTSKGAKRRTLPTRYTGETWQSPSVQVLSGSNGSLTCAITSPSGDLPTTAMPSGCWVRHATACCS
ncbi:PorT family protein [Prevotella dentasini]|uniref:PorT family protein n=1 Tax=Prevotella dentasini TaxID=589537 RepID=UPI001F25E405|nr:PorT family protein [Prevotella dentasini]